ncbi:sensor domain-containing diguanylate cyclase [Clostridium sp. PL3]|uniref:Sensor domain-containing diguanylate cyclase n=1 Tax=Clostridium thailandense TaxID=2794346 RepID=A0A949TKA0_9CLOT|nr:sensor domain-containing diguanylate cyclase [Clostridium thailandense]MBV7274404.1 sensor domain-containing diguanylate cyclase [Clostridium thailandense]
MDSFNRQIIKDINEDKNLFKEMLSRIDTLVALLKLDGTIHFINSAFEKITGVKIKEKECQNISEFFDNKSLQLVIEGLKYVANYKIPYVIEKQVICKEDDQELILKIIMNYIEFKENGFIMLTANDLTHEAQLAKVKDIVIRLNNMLSKYRSLDDYFDDILKSLVEVIPYVELGSILLLDENDYMTMRANVGYDIDMAKNFKLKFEESFFYRCCGENTTRPIIINNLASYSMEGVTSVLDNIHRIEVASSLSSPIIIDGKLRGLLNLDSSRDNIFNNQDLEIMQFLIEQISLVLTSHQLLNQTIYLSKFDQLTGLYNRWYLNDLENIIIPHSLRYKEEFYYVMMDINNLKIINDIYGHIYGDVYIKEFALLLKKYSRETDILIRIGGDEFVGVYFQIDKDSLIGKMKIINEDLKARMEEMGIIEKCGFAYGFVKFPEESKVFDEFIKIADQRMYMKKKDMKEH